MTRRTVVSTPGKVILLGEHAAVYGHPVLVGAVDRRLEVEITARPHEGLHLVLEDLGAQSTLTWSEVDGVAARDQKRWQTSIVAPGMAPSSPDPEALAVIALGEARRTLGSSTPSGLDVLVRSEIPVGAGFGSSAALSVALTEAYRLHVLGSQTAALELVQLALETERRQHGTPSGADVLACVLGGFLWVERDPDGHAVGVPVAASEEHLRGMRLFHSGTPEESTGRIVQFVRQQRAAEPGRIGDALETIDRATRALRAGLERGDAPPELLLSVFRDGARALEELGVVPDEVRRRCRRIEDLGGAAKISGAGGLGGTAAGSILVYHPKPEALANPELFAGWSELSPRFGAPGVRGQSR